MALSLSEIEQKLKDLRKRYDELDKKLVPLNNGVVDGSVSGAMGAVTKEIGRLEALRQQALLGDLIEAEEPKERNRPAPQRVVVDLPLPHDFKADGAPESDPLNGFASLPKGDDYEEFQRGLFDFCVKQIGDFSKTVRSSFKTTNPVRYTQAQHTSVQAALGFVLAQSKLLAATGRDRRDNLERKLVERIQALESRVAEIGGFELDQMKLHAHSDHTLIENALRRLSAIEAVPRITYEGTWSSDRKYYAGQLVTSDGSIFYCRNESQGTKPGTSGDYQLAVKRGRDAKGA